MQNSSTHLSDLLGRTNLQHVQDNFASLAETSVLLVDADGHPVTHLSPRNELVTLVLRSEKGAKLAAAMGRKLCMQNRRSKQSVEIYNQELGMTVAAMPVFLNGKHLGSWLLGRIDFSKETREEMLQRLEAFGINRQAAEMAMESANVSWRYGYDEIIPFMEAVNMIMMRLAHVNYDMMQNNESLVELTEQLDSTAQMLAKFTNSADVGMYVTDFFTGEILQANDRFGKFINKSVEDLTGTRCWKWYDDTMETFCPGCPHDKLLDEKGHPGKPIVWERYLPKLGIWGQFTNQAIYWVDGRLAHMVTIADITQTKQMQEQLANLAYYDRVMHLPNALRLLHDLQNWSAGDEYHLICFDIVMLRTINDVYSRQTGDTLLSEIARWVQRLQIPDSQLYRVDGDEFVLLIKNKDREFAQKTADKICNRFEEPWIFTVSEERIHIFCSITTGVVHVDDPERTDSTELLSLIERTLSTARKTGKTAVYDEAMDNAYKEHVKLELSLKRCIKEGMLGFEVHYQPIVDPIAGTWCSLEALCRWNSPECGEIPPLVFVHEAEQMGLIGTLGRWVLETAVRQCKEWGLDQLDKFLLDVNLSPAQMTDETLVSSVIEILNRYDYPGDKLSLEITESTEMIFSQHCINAIERLRRVNVQVALDDFGTGYSSFNNLKQIPVSILKTEKVFLEDIENDNYLQYLFHVMVELSHAADMKIIAEGVENEEQVRILLKNGVDYMQGYLFSRPLPPEVLAQQLGNFHKVDSVFYSIRDEKVNVQNLLERGHSLTPVLYRTLNRCMQVLSENNESAVYETLKLVGERFRISRATVYWRHGEHGFRKLSEWHNHTVDAFDSIADTIDGSTFESIWMPAFREKGLILAMDAQKLPGEMYSRLCEIGTKAVVVMPIWKDDVLQGMVGFEDCQNYRDWLPEEVLMLNNLTLLLSGALQRRMLQDELGQRDKETAAPLGVK